MRIAAALIFGLCGVLLLLTWHGYEGHPLWIWNGWASPRHLNDLDFLLKIAGATLVGTGLLCWPKRSIR